MDGLTVRMRARPGDSDEVPPGQGVASFRLTIVSPVALRLKDGFLDSLPPTVGNNAKVTSIITASVGWFRYLDNVEHRFGMLRS